MHEHNLNGEPMMQTPVAPTDARTRLLVVSQRHLSSGLAGYIEHGFVQNGRATHFVDFWQHYRCFKLGGYLRSIRLNRDSMYRRRMVNFIFSSRAWDRNTRLNGRLLDATRKPGDAILQVSNTYYPHPDYRNMEYYVFINYNILLSVADGITPWVPDPSGLEAFVERERNLYQHAGTVFVGAEYAKKSLVEDYGVSPDRVAVTGCGVDDEFLESDPGETREAGTRTCLFVGWDFGMKGGPCVVNAFREARKELPDLSLHIVGPHTDPAPGEPGVVYIGPVRDRKELIDQFRSADIFLMPSWRDSYGFVFLEAMSQGVPCIGANVNAMPEIIGHGERGYIVEAGNSGQLADCLVEFFRSPETRIRMSRAARQRVHDYHVWSKVAGRMMSCMQSGPKSRE